MVKRKIIQLDPAAPCPCRSGKLLQECCLLPNGILRKQLPTFLPPPPRTGHARSGCYLASTSDCSMKISAEHYISRSVLEAIGTDVAAIAGAPWLRDGEQKAIGINNLTAKILCSRHNSALSGLDDAAGIFFKKLQAIHADFQRKSLSRKRSFVILSGEALELWMLKLACGLFYSKNAAEDGARLVVDHHLNEKLVQEAIFQSLWHDGCGLYMKAPQGPRTSDTNAISMAPLIALSENQVVGRPLRLQDWNSS
jgi:hypothetical protein